MVVMVIVSIISWFPYGVTCIVLPATGSSCSSSILITSVVAKVSVICNPIIYVAFNKKFMVTYKLAHE